MSDAAEVLREQMHHDFITFAERHPVQAYELYRALESVVRFAPYPRLRVETIDVDGEPEPVLMHPTEDTPIRQHELCSVDIAERWTPADDDIDFEHEQVTFHYDGYGDYEGLVYLLNEQPVRLPEGWSET